MDVSIGQSGLLAEAIGTIAFQNGERVIHSIPRHLARHEVSFEVITLDATLRSSEVLSDFCLKLGGQIAYAGRATITAITSLGTRTVCTVALEGGWTESSRRLADAGALSGAFDGFLECIQDRGISQLFGAERIRCRQDQLSVLHFHQLEEILHVTLARRKP